MLLNIIVTMVTPEISFLVWDIILQGSVNTSHSSQWKFSMKVHCESFLNSFRIEFAISELSCSAYAVRVCLFLKCYKTTSPVSARNTNKNIDGENRIIFKEKSYSEHDWLSIDYLNDDMSNLISQRFVANFRVKLNM